MNAELRDRLKKLFAKAFEKGLFEVSMGETHPGLNSLQMMGAFLAQAIAYFVHEDPRFADAAISIHKKMTAAVDRFSDDQSNPIYQFSMNVGTVLEKALLYVNEMHTEDGGCPDCKDKNGD
jgi:hypothetical protein